MKNTNIINIISIMIVMTLVVNFISASASVSPSTISISAYPGETIYKNLTITTSETGLFNMTHTIFGNTSEVVNIIYPSNLLIEKSRIITVTFIFPTDIIPQAFNVNFSTITEVADSVAATVTPSGGSGGSSGGGVWFKIGDKIYTPAMLNDSYINVNGTYYYSNGRYFIKQTNFSLVNQSVINISNINGTNGILNQDVKDQTKDFFSLLRSFFLGIWHWIFG